MNEDVVKNKLKELMNNQTCKEVLESFSIRERHRPQSSLTKLYGNLIRLGSKIVPGDFQNLFNQLESIGLGRRMKGNKFEWYYNIKDIGNYALGNSNVLHKMVSTTIPDRKRTEGLRRPIGTKTVSGHIKPRLVLMITTSSGEEVPLNLEDLEQINTQVKEFKSKLS